MQNTYTKKKSDPLTSKKIVILAPAYNEEASVDYFFKKFGQIEEIENLSFEYVVVDDGSEDRTLEKLLPYVKTHNLKLVKLDGNFGQHTAIYAGLDNIRVENTDYVALLDFDLQNPPEKAIEMLLHMHDNDHDIVYGIRDDVKVGNGKLSQIFWFMIGLFTSMEIPRDQSSLKVFDKETIDRIQKLKSRPKFFPAALAVVQQNHGTYFVNTVSRQHGESNYNIRANVKLFMAYFLSVVFREIVSRSHYEIDKIYTYEN